MFTDTIFFSTSKERDTYIKIIEFLSCTHTSNELAVIQLLPGKLLTAPPGGLTGICRTSAALSVIALGGSTLIVAIQGFNSSVYLVR